jgi:hypothetical protein
MIHAALRLGRRGTARLTGRAVSFNKETRYSGCVPSIVSGTLSPVGGSAALFFFAACREKSG